VATFEKRYAAAEVTLRVRSACPGARVPADGSRLALVLSNLLGNALKYTPAGGEVVIDVVRQAQAMSGPARLQLAVTDTGPGIPPEFLDRVFEKFFRIEHKGSTAPASVQGAGFGLYLCRQIVEAHGGSIRCEPRRDRSGTRITIELPIEAPVQLASRALTS
jgi:two-component system, NtrC family, sensor histidine kinase KinB